MAGTRLQNQTGNRRIDSALARTVGLLEERFLGQIRSHFLVGSWAYGQACPTSDIDLVAVLRADTDPEVGTRARHLVDELAAQHGLDLGIFPVLDRSIHPVANVHLKLGALHLFGDDIRPELKLVSSVDWARQNMHSMYVLTGRFRGMTEMRPPLDFPKPDDEFFGFTEERRRGSDGIPRQGTRDLVTDVGWTATALIGHRSGAFVVRKVDVPSAYARHIGDEWTDYIGELFHSCRDTWQYRIPQEPHDRGLLRDLCTRTLEFKNHFLRCYLDFLLSELRGQDATGRDLGIQAMERLPYRDHVITGSLESVRLSIGAAESR